MNIHIKTAFVDEDARVEWGTYGADGSTALRLYALDGEPLATATVCIVEYGFTPRPDQIVIKDYSENAGMTEVLEAAGLIEPVSQWVNGPGDIMFPVAKLSKTALADLAKARGEAIDEVQE